MAALDGDDADPGDTVAVIDTSREPEWRLTARIVKRVRTFGEGVVARVTIGTVEPSAASVTVVENTATTAIDDLDKLADLDF